MYWDKFGDFIWIWTLVPKGLRNVSFHLRENWTTQSCKLLRVRGRTNKLNLYSCRCTMYMYTVPPLGLTMKASYLAETGLTTEPWLVSKLRWSVGNHIKYEKAKKATFEPNMALTGRSLKIIFFKPFIIMGSWLC